MEGNPGDTEEISIQVVFQGGGAKLVVLVAAAKVIFDEKTRLGLILSRISGTSAGAIAGCILATGKDPELFRKDILRLAPLYLPQIQKQIGWTRSFDVMRGVPLFDATLYREFLRELFISAGKVSHLKKLATPVLFHATNIKNGASKMFDGSREEDTIEEALFCSSALPYIFETFKGQPYVDGGLISNFPAYSLKQRGFEKDQIIGFSFPATNSYPYQAGLISYSKSLMFTTMDLSVARARGELPPENVYEFQTSIGTLDFDKALAHLRDDIEFENYKRQARSFLEEFVSRQKAKREIEVRTKDIEDESKRALEEEKIKHEQELETIYSSVRVYHDQVCSTSPFKILKKTIVNTCNALRSNDKKTLDFLSVTDVFIPTNKTVTGYGAMVMIGNKSADVEAIRPELL